MDAFHAWLLEEQGRHPPRGAMGEAIGYALGQWDEAGENLAGLYSLIATCEANEVNPVTYLADVLIRVQTHPASRIDELLPHLWASRLPAPP